MNYEKSFTEVGEIKSKAAEVGTISSSIVNYDEMLTKDKEIQFIPRRMINCVRRLVTVANDMEIIRPGKDVFKIIYIISCIDALWKLGNHKKAGESEYSAFFNQYSSVEDKKMFSDNVWIFYKDYIKENPYIEVKKEDVMGIFLRALYKIRNNGVHESDYWDIYFHDGKQLDYTMLFVIELNPHKGEKRRDINFSVKLTYHNFIEIFVRTCASYIKEYIRIESHKRKLA